MNKEILLLEDILNSLSSTNTKNLVKEITKKIKTYDDYDAVGIRLESNNDYPYFFTEGFSDEFVEKENYICSLNGNLACLCGKVISGKINKNLPCFTERGSFWTNDLDELLFSMSKKEKSEIRGKCNTEGYKSLALIPLKTRNKTIGLLQIDDKLPNKFTKDKLNFLESISSGISNVINQYLEREELLEDESKLSAILDGTKNGVIICKIEDKNKYIITDFNKAAQKIEKVKASDVIGKDLNSDFPSVKELGLLEVLNRVNKTGKSEHLGTRFYKGSKVEGYRENWVFKIRDKELVIVYSDETERKKNEEKIIEAQKMDSIGNLTAGIAHDFNNLLTITMGYSNLLENSFSENIKIQDMIKKINVANLKMKDLISKLLDYSRKSDSKKESINLNKIVNETINLFEISSKKIKINKNLEEITNIDGDSGQINQIIMNLLVNSKHAMNDKGTIYINTYEKENKIYLKIEDEGCGIDNKIIKKIFDPYFTTKTNKELKGTGLGLAVVYGIVKNHGGDISVDSEVGSGTTFEIKFPKGNIKNSYKENLTNEIIKNKNNCPILVVDDEISVSTLLKEILLDLGYKPTIVNSGKDALDIYQKEHSKYGAVILDYQLNDMNGDEIYKKMREINYTPTLMISGYSDNKVKNILDLGLNGFIRKPFDLGELASVLEKIVIHKS